MSDKIILYSFWRSSCAWRVRLVLNLKGIPYDVKTINLDESVEEQFSSDFEKVNPIHQVPALQIDGQTLTESLPIIEYLEETHPQCPLLPKDALKRAKVREICAIIASGIQPMQNDAVINRVENQKEWIEFFIKRGFKAVERLLETCAGRFAVGDEITLADCCLIPMVYNARLNAVDLVEYPTIVRIDKVLEENPAFRNAHPSSQPDCP